MIVAEQDHQTCDFWGTPETEMTGMTVAVLDERVKNHIKFFWTACGLGLAWMGSLSVCMYNMNNTLGRLEHLQADSTTQIVASLLQRKATSKEETAEILGAVTTVLRTARISRTKPDPALIKTVSSEIANAQDKYADLPETWQATSALINYKSRALPPPSNRYAIARGVECTATMGNEGWVFSNCEVVLDDLLQRIRDNKVNGKPAPFIFVNSIVHYNGGPLPSTRMLFQDSVFEFHIPKTPPPSEIFAMRQLTIAQDPSRVEITT